jgi:hypothetical protein
LPAELDRYFPPVDAEYEAQHIPNGECRVVKSVRRSLFERFATRLTEPIVVERQIYCMKCKIRERWLLWQRTEIA